MDKNKEMSLLKFIILLYIPLVYAEKVDLYPIQDTMVRGGVHANTVQTGSIASTSIGIKNGGAIKDIERRPVMKFGSKYLTNGLTNAVLRLTKRFNQDSGNITLKLLTNDSWDQSTVTYNNLNTNGTVVATGPFNSPSSSTSYYFNMYPAAKLEFGKDGFVTLYMTVDKTTNEEIYSSEHGTPSFRPELSLYYDRPAPFYDGAIDVSYVTYKTGEISDLGFLPLGFYDFSVTITNKGTLPITFFSTSGYHIFVSGGQFSLISADIPSILNPGEKSSAILRVDGRVAGTKTGTLTISNNLPGYQNFSIGLRATSSSNVTQNSFRAEGCTIYSHADCYVSGGTDKAKPNNTTNLLVAAGGKFDMYEAGDYGGSGNYITYLNFDLTGIKPGVTFSTVKMKLYVRSKVNNGMQTLWLFRNNDWTESTLSWNTQPHILNPHKGIIQFNDPNLVTEPIAHAPAKSAGEWIEFDITSAINKEVASRKNISFVLRTFDSDRVTYASRESGEETAPKIEITYGTPLVLPDNRKFPNLFITEKEKGELETKIAKYAWAKNNYNSIISSVEDYANRHRREPEWLLSRMCLNWSNRNVNYGYTGNGTVEQPSKNEGWDWTRYNSLKGPFPTIRGSFGRDWTMKPPLSLDDYPTYFDNGGDIKIRNQYLNEPDFIANIKDSGSAIIFYHTKFMYDIAARAAFLYWMTKQEKYGKLAADLLWQWTIAATHMNMFYNNEGMDQALLNAETIHEGGLFKGLALTYNFIRGYLKDKGADTYLIEHLLKRHLDSYLVKGNIDNNWEIWESSTMLYGTALLENNSAYPDGKGKEFYYNRLINEDTPGLAPFTAKSGNNSFNTYYKKQFDQYTGIQWEPSLYSLAMLKDVSLINYLFYQQANVRLSSLYPAMRSGYNNYLSMRDNRGFSVPSGDGSYLRIPVDAYEYAYSYAKKSGDKELELIAGKNIYDETAGKRSYVGLELLLSVSGDVQNNSAAATDLKRGILYLQGHNMLILRNGKEPETGALASIYTSTQSHGHANGLALQIWGLGYPLVGESWPMVSYSEPEHAYRGSQFSHSTVVIDGGGNGPLRAPIKNIETIPRLDNEGSYANSFEMSQNIKYMKASYDYAHEGTTPRTGSQTRTVISVRTSDDTYYYIDIAMSKRVGGVASTHTSFYKPTGFLEEVKGVTSGKLSPIDAPRRIFNDLKYKGTRGYSGGAAFSTAIYITNDKNLLTDEQISVIYNQKNKTTGAEFLSRFWFKPYEGVNREYIFAEGTHDRGKDVYTELGLDGTKKKDTDKSIFVEQSGDAWVKPFVTVLDFSKNRTDWPLSKVNFLKGFSDNSYFEVIEIESASVNKHTTGRMDTIFFGTNVNSFISTNGIGFKGSIGLCAKTGNSLSTLFIGNGFALSNQGYSIFSANNVPISGVLEIEEKGIFVSGYDNISIQLPLSKSNVTNFGLYALIGGKKVRFQGTNIQINSTLGYIRGVVPMSKFSRTEIFLLPLATSEDIEETNIKLLVDYKLKEKLSFFHLGNQEVKLQITDLELFNKSIVILDPSLELVPNTSYTTKLESEAVAELFFDRKFPWEKGNYLIQLKKGDYIAFSKILKVDITDKKVISWPNPYNIQTDELLKLEFVLKQEQINECKLSLVDFTGHKHFEIENLNSIYVEIPLKEQFFNNQLRPGIYFLILQNKKSNELINSSKIYIK